MSISTDTALSEIVSSPRALSALKKAGFNTLSDCADLVTVAAIPYVGTSTVEEIAAAGDIPAEAPYAGPETNPLDIEECDNPICMSSPYDKLAIRLTEAGEIRDGKRVRVINPKFISFSGGEAKLTKQMWAEMIHDGDAAAKRAFVKSNEPWRVEADAWLRAKPSFRDRSFIIKD